MILNAGGVTNVSSNCMASRKNNNNIEQSTVKLE
jgi:hypothetical protein